MVEESQSPISEEDIEQLLRQSLIRLSRLVEGRDANLNGLLEQLREQLQHPEALEYERLESLVEAIRKSILDMDDLRREDARLPLPVRPILSFIHRFELPSEPRKRLRKIEESIANNLNLDIEQLISDLQELLLEMAQSLPIEIGGEKPPAEQHDEVRDIFEELIGDLDMPKELAGPVARLRQRIKEGEPLPALLIMLAKLVSEARKQQRQERNDMERFLKEISDNLEQLDSHIQDVSLHGEERFSHGQQLDQQLRKEVQGMQSSLDGVHDLLELKSVVLQRFASIRQHIEAFTRQDEQKHAEFEDKIGHMKAKINALEAVSGILRERLMKEHGQAIRDSLTGAYNRMAYDERMEEQFARWKRYDEPFVLSVWDVDYFKSINDNYGHHAGDKVLKGLVQILEAHSRKTDMIARYGGEEFIFLMINTGVDEAMKVAEKLRDAIARMKFVYHKKHVPVTISCGLAEVRKGDDAETLFQRADKALYKAKQDGRNCCRSEKDLTS